MTRSLKDKLNKFLNANKQDLELITLFKFLIKANPEVFVLDGQPFLSRHLPLRTYGYLKKGLIEIHEWKKLDKPYSPVKSSIMKFITDSQEDGAYNSPVINEIRVIEKQQKEKQELAKRWKLARKTYNDLPRYTNFFDYKSYFEESQKFVSEWEQKPELVQLNLTRLRNLKYE